MTKPAGPQPIASALDAALTRLHEGIKASSTKTEGEAPKAEQMPKPGKAISFELAQLAAVRYPKIVGHGLHIACFAAVRIGPIVRKDVRPFGMVLNRKPRQRQSGFRHMTGDCPSGVSGLAACARSCARSPSSMLITISLTVLGIFRPSQAMSLNRAPCPSQEVPCALTPLWFDRGPHRERPSRELAQDKGARCTGSHVGAYQRTGRHNLCATLGSIGAPTGARGISATGLTLPGQAAHACITIQSFGTILGQIWDNDTGNLL